MEGSLSGGRRSQRPCPGADPFSLAPCFSCACPLQSSCHTDESLKPK